MPIARCQYCGFTTNSAVSNYWQDKEIDGITPKEIEVATRCYAAFADGKWIEGCAYHHLTSDTQETLQNLFADQD